MVMAEYVKDGKKYDKIGRGDTIEPGAMQSLDNGELRPIMGVDTIGDKPSSFSDQRDFYNPVQATPGSCPLCRKIDHINCERTDIYEKPFNCNGCGRIIVLGEKFNPEK